MRDYIQVFRFCRHFLYPLYDRIRHVFSSWPWRWAPPPCIERKRRNYARKSNCASDYYVPVSRHRCPAHNEAVTIEPTPSAPCWQLDYRLL